MSAKPVTAALPGPGLRRLQHRHVPVRGGSALCPDGAYRAFRREHGLSHIRLHRAVYGSGLLGHGPGHPGNARPARGQPARRGVSGSSAHRGRAPLLAPAHSVRVPDRSGLRLRSDGRKRGHEPAQAGPSGRGFLLLSGHGLHVHRGSVRQPGQIPLGLAVRPLQSRDRGPCADGLQRPDPESGPSAE